MTPFTRSDLTEIEEGTVIAPSMYWAVVPGEAYAMRYSTARNSLLEAKIRRMRQQRRVALAEKRNNV